MTRETPMLVATDSFIAERDGAPRIFVKGETRLRAGHPWLKGIEHLFEPIEGHYRDVESATQAPGERRA